MMTPIPANEKERLRSLYALEILDTQTELHYDLLTQLAAKICDCPHAMITLIDKDRQWFKSTYQISIQQEPRDGGFCSAAILEKNLFVVSDALLDERFRNHPYVLNDPKIRFYAASPIAVEADLNVGVICVIDNKPRRLDSNQTEALQTLSQMVATLLSNRKLASEQRMLREQRKAAETTIAHASQMLALAEIAGGVAHEINNPLGVMRLALACLKKELKKSVEGAQSADSHLPRIESAIDRIVKITRSLSTYSRDSRQDAAVQTPIHAIIEDTLTFCRDHLIHNEIDLTLDLGKQDSLLECRPVQISQILLNLIKNSADAVAGLKIRKIEISIHDQENWVEIRVRDSGKGVPMELRERIFQPFFTTKAVHQGTGLGLSLCRGIAENHGGTIEVQPHNESTCFVLRLPRIQKKAA